ncbi:AAA family ATPase [Colwellia sp. MB02u-14]|jgi:predicted kinase|uniref:AAA family ATPase n=1 Tax=Colwellia sp. MB02u-14 TaxID=2759815 RepID=UPI0015F502FA|nr:AAA family ATPase [Colwellia sp. MB02u-14]MBA6302351.1 AAA family ATPase [Colwellia sp. MB02u-14]
MPTLYIFSGLPGAGKSTLAVLLCKHIGASYLRVDTIEQSLKDICGLDIYAEGYQLAYRLASDSLNQGLSVVGDSCNSVPESRDEWEQTAINSAAQYINIEILCSDTAEHKARVENRKSAVKGLALPTWESVKNRVFHSWDSTVISINTAGQSPEQSMKQLLTKLGV